MSKVIPFLGAEDLRRLAEADINVYQIRASEYTVYFDIEYRFNYKEDGGKPCWRKVSVPIYYEGVVPFDPSTPFYSTLVDTLIGVVMEAKAALEV